MRCALVCLVLAGLVGCAQLPPAARVVLLPKADGSSSGAVLVQQGGASLLLEQPYAQADVSTGGQISAVQSNAAAVQRDYAALLDMQPLRARSFVVNFASNSNALTPQTAPVLAEVQAALTNRPAGELVVIGHTDRVGSLEANDKLSLTRASAVRELLVKQGVPREQIDIAGRGERELLLATPDEVAEARNRRVEIKLR